MRKPKRKRHKKHIHTLEQVEQLLTLIKEWTRYEIAARLLPLETNLCIDYYRRMLEKENEIRFLLYGSSDLPTLAKLQGMNKTEDEVVTRPTRQDAAFKPDEERARRRSTREAELSPRRRSRTARSRTGTSRTETGDVGSDIEAILIAAGVK
ncbi:hypothetical protein LCGC14_2050040 [marine sediment metagenome]|uniref:Uncharacterized protein n=1 Tax=marine sediment metagenome TaxID=412755 RepID=A0A0F9EPE5_9ZZZZ